MEERIKILDDAYAAQGLPGTLAPFVVRYNPAPGEYYYRMTSGSVNWGNPRTSVIVHDQQGFPTAGVMVHSKNGGLEQVSTDGSGRAQFHMGPGSKHWEPDQGPHSLWIATLPSDRIVGTGMPNGQYADFSFGFRLVYRQPDDDNGNGQPEDPAPGGLLGLIGRFLRWLVGLLGGGK